MINIGCCGWSESQAKYFRDFKVLEVQETFYQPGGIKKARPLAGRIRYFRLHGLPTYDLGYRYTSSDLQRLLDMVDRKSAYVLFNNNSMRNEALRFRRLVGTE